MLRELRNSLVHYKPQWIESHNNEGREIHRFEEIFASKFDDNKLFEKTGNAYFPERCLGAGCAGCAVWATRVAIDFTEEFYNRLGYDIEPIYKKEFNTLRIC